MLKGAKYSYYTYLSLGSNLGNRKGNLLAASRELEKKCGEILSTSSYYESEAWGFDSDNVFLNQCVLLQTALDPAQLLDQIHVIEEELGRLRLGEEFNDRNIDIDILLFDSLQIATVRLSVPHPLMTERNFVLDPLKEIAPDYIHPALQKSIAQLSEECTDQVQTRRLSDKE